MGDIVHKTTDASTWTVDLAAWVYGVSNIRLVEIDASEEFEAEGRRVGQLSQVVGRRE